MKQWFLGGEPNQSSVPDVVRCDVAAIQEPYYYQYRLYPYYYSDGDYGDYEYNGYYMAYVYYTDEVTDDCATQLVQAYGEHYYVYYVYDGDDQATRSTSPWPLTTLVNVLTLDPGFALSDVISAMLYWKDDDTQKTSYGYYSYYGARDGSERAVEWTYGCNPLVWAVAVASSLGWWKFIQHFRALLARTAYIRRLCRIVADESSRDLRATIAILVTCLCDLLLLVVRRIPYRPCRRLARKCILRARSVVQNLEKAEKTEEGPEVTGATVGYRPLCDMQAARWGGKRRWTAPRHLCSQVVYNPRQHGECLFLAIAYVIKQQVHRRTSVRELRELVQRELLAADKYGLLLEGKTVSQWASALGCTTSALISATGARPRWGNTLDALLIAQKFDLAVHIVDIDANVPLLQLSSSSGRSAHFVAWSRQHFFVRRLRKQLHTKASPPHQAVQGGAMGGHLPRQCCVHGRTGNNEKVLVQDVCTGYSLCPTLTAATGDMQDVGASHAPLRCSCSLQVMAGDTGDMQDDDGDYSFAPCSCSSQGTDGIGVGIVDMQEDGYDYSFVSCSCSLVGNGIVGIPVDVGSYSLATRSPTTQNIGEAHPPPLRLVSGGAKCLLDNTSQVLNNPTSLQRRERVHLHHLPPRQQHAPMCWWTDESYQERREAAEAAERLRIAIATSVSSAQGWKQQSRTPERRPSLELVHGGAAGSHDAPDTPLAVLAVGGAKGDKAAGSAADQVVWNPNKRVYPFAPAFAKVVAFPPPKLMRLIEATSFHTARAPTEEVRSALEERIFTEGNADTTFLATGHLYRDFYEACVITHRRERAQEAAQQATGPTTASSAASSSAASAGTACKAPAAKPKSMPRARRPPAKATAPQPNTGNATLAAVQAVAKRRAAMPKIAAIDGIIDISAEEVGPEGQMANRQEEEQRLMPPPPVPQRVSALRKAAAQAKALSGNQMPVKHQGVPGKAMPARRQTVQLVAADQVVADMWMPPDQPWDACPEAEGGILKLATPLAPGLGHYFRTTLQPLAALLGIRVVLVARRGEDTHVRVHYIREWVTRPLPLRAVTIEENADLRIVLGNVQQFFKFQYLEATLSGDGISSILNFWSDRGRVAQDALLATLHAAITHAAATLRLVRPKAGILLYQAFHLVLLATPLTSHPDMARLDEVQRCIGDFLDRNPIRAEGQQWALKAKFVIRAGGVNGAPATTCSNPQKQQPQQVQGQPHEEVMHLDDIQILPSSIIDDYMATTRTSMRHADLACPAFPSRVFVIRIAPAQSSSVAPSCIAVYDLHHDELATIAEVRKHFAHKLQ
eukprot:3790671-Amphidinium_carterae.1